MKISLKCLLLLVAILTATNTFAQVGIGTNTPAASAALEVTSDANNKGILIPRITATQKDAISNPAEGLMVYQTSAPAGFYYYNGSAWKLMAIQADIASKVGYTEALVSANTNVSANTAKVGITTAQAADILTNNAKVGYTEALVSANTNVSANTAKVGITTAQANAIVANTAKVGITTAQAADILTNNAKVGYTEALVSANTNVSANTAKVGITTAQANAIVANTAKVGITTAQAADILTNNAKVGYMDALVVNKAPLASPTLTGTPLAPTAAAGTNTTQIATTQFVTGEITAANAVVVPYTGATQAVDLGAHNLTVNGVSVGIGSGAISSNTAIGGSALSRNTSGSNNTANGVYTLVNNTTGSNNSAHGIYALEMNTTGSNNTSNGMYALSSNTTGDYNTSSGLHALSSNTTGSYNTAIGFNANVATGLLTNATAIGSNAVVTTNNTIQLGNTAITAVNTSGTITAAGFSGLATNLTGLPLTTGVTGTLAVANGGTGASTLTANNVLLGNGAGSLQAVAPGTSGNVLTSNGTTWTSAAVSGGLPTGNNPGDMLYWNNTAWVKVAAGSNGQTLAFYNDAPVWIGTTANSNTVLNPTTGKIWMDRNLGATQVATSSTDYLAYGDLYQWGRGADGHQLITWTDATTGTAVNSTTTTPSSADVPGNANFILTLVDWRSPKNDNLWQGVNGINNPCPSGYRLPTDAEWVTEHASWISQNAAGAFASSLKFPVAGYRVPRDGSLFLVGNTGHYWSSTVSGVDSRMLYFNTGGVPHNAVNRARGYSVRCLKD